MIDSVSYKDITDNLGIFYSMGSESISSLDSAETVLSNTEVSTSLSNRKSQINFAINALQLDLSRNHVSLGNDLLLLVRGIQEHVLGFYDSVDDYLSDNGILVSVEFASLSTACGYDISVSNIEDSGS